MKIETLAVHGGYTPDPTTKAVAVPAVVAGEVFMIPSMFFGRPLAARVVAAFSSSFSGVAVAGRKIAIVAVICAMTCTSTL